jgi:hypothetical protein
LEEIDGGKFIEVDERTAPRLARSVKRRGRNRLNNQRKKGPPALNGRKIKLSLTPSSCKSAAQP